MVRLRNGGLKSLQQGQAKTCTEDEGGASAPAGASRLNLFVIASCNGLCCWGAHTMNGQTCAGAQGIRPAHDGGENAGGLRVYVDDAVAQWRFEAPEQRSAEVCTNDER